MTKAALLRLLKVKAARFLLRVRAKRKSRPSSSTTAALAAHLPSIQTAVLVQAATDRVPMELAEAAKALEAAVEAEADVELHETLNRLRMLFLRVSTAKAGNKATCLNPKVTSQRVSLWRRSLNHKTIS